jgi:hypothetical protein
MAEVTGAQQIDSGRKGGHGMVPTIDRLARIGIGLGLVTATAWPGPGLALDAQTLAKAAETQSVLQKNLQELSNLTNQGLTASKKLTQALNPNQGIQGGASRVSNAEIKAILDDEQKIKESMTQKVEQIKVSAQELQGLIGHDRTLAPLFMNFESKLKNFENLRGVHRAEMPANASRDWVQGKQRELAKEATDTQGKLKELQGAASQMFAALQKARPQK